MNLALQRARGLGAYEPEGEPWYGGSTVTAQPAVTTTKPNTWDTINKAIDLTTKAANVYTQVKSGTQQPVVNYQSPQTTSGGSAAPPPPPAPSGSGMSTTTKVLIGVTAATLLVGTAYALTRKKKKGLGCAEPVALGGVKKKKKKGK